MDRLTVRQLDDVHRPYCNYYRTRVCDEYKDCAYVNGEGKVEQCPYDMSDRARKYLWELENEAEKREVDAVRRDILLEAIKTYGMDHQVDMAIEEMAELTKALLKQRRGEGPLYDIAEEMADAQITLDQLKMIYGWSQEIEDAKVKRLLETIKTAN